MPGAAGGKDPVADRMVQHPDLARADRGGHLTFEWGRNPHVVRKLGDVVDSGGLHRLQRRDVARQQQRLVGRDDAHVAVVEVVKPSISKMPRGIVQQVAHGQLVRPERLLVGIRLEG